jgi:hypothetical protein
MFRFTIRDVLWLMVVVAMGLGWWSHVTALRKESPQYANELLKLELVRAQRALEALQNPTNATSK